LSTTSSSSTAPATAIKQRTLEELGLELKLGHLKSEEQVQIKQLLQEFSDVFATSYEDIKESNIDYYHDIITPSDMKPISLRNYHHSPEDEAIIEKECQAMLQGGILQHSTSPFNHPLILIRNPHSKKTRVVIDLRALNKYEAPKVTPFYRTPRCKTVWG